MNKKIVALLLVFVMMFSLAACGNTGDETTGTELEETVVVYTTHSEDLLTAIAEDFTAETGVAVEFINLKGELADRVRSEKENPQADIMFGGDAATYMVLDAEGCYAATQPTWAADIDAAYKDAEGNWYGTYRTPMVLFYNTEMMTAEEAPKDWADLAGEAFADKIVTRDSLSSSMRSTICSLVAYNMTNQGEEAAWNYIEALSANTKNFYNSGSMMYQAVGKGEAAVSMAVINDVLTNRDQNQMPIEMVIPASGAVVITDCIAAINNAPHPNAAAAFIEYVGGAACQTMTANEFNRMPVADTILADCPEWMQTEFSAMDVDWTAISENQSAWLEKWETNYVDAAKTVAKN